MSSTTATVSSQAEKYKNLGNEFFKKGDFMHAIENYTLSIEIDDRNPAYWNNRAAAYLKTGELQKAHRDARKAAEIDPGWDKCHWRVGTILVAMGEHSQALEAFQKALHISPTTASYKKDYEETKKKVSAGELAKLEGNFLFKNGRFASAVEQYEKALSLAGDEKDLKADLLNNIAACCLQQEAYNLEKVVDCATQVLEIRPDDPKSLLRRGQALEAMEKYKRALADFEMVLRAYPDNAMAGAAVHRIRRAMASYGIA